jgi:hypothetical protein
MEIGKEVGIMVRPAIACLLAVLSVGCRMEIDKAKYISGGSIGTVDLSAKAWVSVIFYKTHRCEEPYAYMANYALFKHNSSYILVLLVGRTDIVSEAYYIESGGSFYLMKIPVPSLDAPELVLDRVKYERVDRGTIEVGS